ncbi:MAG TPA: hypothetical protein PKV17_13420, partial [Aquabacterium sp.]|nr:hypothetical protein [Aquabacterium sp.]
PVHVAGFHDDAAMQRLVLMGFTMRPSAAGEGQIEGEGAVFEDLVASPQYCVDKNGKTTYQGDETTPLRWGDARA